MFLKMELTEQMHILGKSTPHSRWSGQNVKDCKGKRMENEIL